MIRRVRAGLMVVVALLLSGGLRAAEKSSATQLIEMAQTRSPGLREAITASLDAKELKEGSAWVARGPEFSLRRRPRRNRNFSLTGPRGRRCRIFPGLIFGTQRRTLSPLAGCIPITTL